MRRAWMGALLLAIAAGCGGKGGGNSNETGRVTVKLIVPPAGSPDPFQNITTLHLEVRQGATVVYQEDVGPGVPVVVQGLTAGTGRSVLLQGKDSGGNVVSHGVTTPFDFVEGQSIEVPLYFGRSNSFNAVHGTPTARTGAVSAGFPDGHVLIAGGLSGSTGLATAELYDPSTDTTSAAGTMPGGAHALVNAVFLSTAEVLVAGGASGLTGASAAADVFTLSGATGSWASGVPAMSSPRRDVAMVSLGGGHALAAGGDTGSGFPLGTTEVFTWTGSTGSWAAAALMRSVRMGAIAVPGTGGRAAVCGGANLGAEGGGNESKTCDVFTLAGPSATQVNGTDLRYPVGYMGVAPIGANIWLLTGGETDTATASFSAHTQTIRWMGPGVQTAQTADLPSAHRRGGGFLVTAGTALVAGGDTGTRPVLAPVDETESYSVGADQFANAGATAGPTTTFTGWPLPDGTFLVVCDGVLYRYVP